MAEKIRTYFPPGDKSITIRALLMSAIAEGSARLENPLYCDDTASALECLEALGVRLCREGTAIIVEGRGLNGLIKPSGPLDAGESGALARLLSGILSSQNFPSAITGRGTLLNRPMIPVAEAIKKLGAKVTVSKNGGLPLKIKPARLKGGVISGITSAQIKTALLFAGLSAKGPTTLKEKSPSRDHTERLLALMGARLIKKGPLIRLEPGNLTARPINIPGDISSAAPFIAAAVISRTPLELRGCGLNPSRTGFLDALIKMGAKIRTVLSGSFPEPYGAIRVQPSKLRAASFSADDIPGMIDEIPLLAVCAACAAGVTVLRGLGPLRSKESDRIESTLALLRSLKVKASSARGTIRVEGGKISAARPVETFSDHRIAMAAAAASLIAPKLEIRNPGCVAKSYPGFWEDFRKTFQVQ